MSKRASASATVSTPEIVSSVAVTVASVLAHPLEEVFVRTDSEFVNSPVSRVESLTMEIVIQIFQMAKVAKQEIVIQIFQMAKVAKQASLSQTVKNIQENKKMD
jgi:hypothetical protein